MRPLIGFILLFAGCHSAVVVHEDYKPKAAAVLLLCDGHTPAPSPAPSGKCINCNGTGILGDGTIKLKCPVCGGDGIVANELPLINLVSMRTPHAGQALPAPEVKTTTSTEPPQDAVSTTVAVPSSTEPTAADYPHGFVPSVDSALLCHVCGEPFKGGHHGPFDQMPLNSLPRPSPPSGNAATATGRTYSACGPNGCPPAAVSRQYVTLSRQAILPWRRR